MPIAHFSVSVRRTGQSQSATDVVHYLTREGAWQHKNGEAYDDDVAYMKRTHVNTKSRNDLVNGDTKNLPAWAQGDAATFFHEAAFWERHKGRYAYVIQMSLPRSLTHEQHMALKDDFIEAVMPRNPLVWVKHEPVARDGKRNPHIHIMVSARLIDDIERRPQQMFARFCREDPARGGCEKDRFWNERGALRQLRMAYTDMCNFSLEKNRQAERLDPRTLYDQGIDRPSFGKASRGKVLERDIAAEQAKAAAAWEQRKAYKHLGDIRAIPREEFVLLVRQWTSRVQPGQQLPRATTQEVRAWHEREAARNDAHRAALAQQQSALATMIAEVDDYLTRDVRMPPHRLVSAMAMAQDTEMHGRGLTMSLDEEKGQGHGR